MKTSRRLEAQKQRFREGRAQILDLFAGCGGFSLGFQRAGFRIIGGVEIEPVRAATFLRNLRPDLWMKLPPEVRAKPVRPHPESAAINICATSPQEALQRFGITKHWESAVDGIIGGPPCQAYARIGRAKLREIGRSADAHLEDPRGRLYEEYLNYVRTLRPLFVVMENVPDILSVRLPGKARHGQPHSDESGSVIDNIAQELGRLGYEVRYTLLNAAGYGVPQYRERLFLVGLLRELGDIEPPMPPLPECRLNLPVGFRGTCGAAQRAVERKGPFIKALPCYEAADREPVSTKDALSDLPRIHERLLQEKKGVRNLERTHAYFTDASTPYQKLMRTWPGFEPSDGVTAHETRYLLRDFPVFAAMKEGDDYPRALEVARRMGIEIPYDGSKFPNKWRKLEQNAPARTLMAHLAHDSYTHIHYDSKEQRTITVREAARLQSFPDGFMFAGAMNQAFGQIGNAVPPLVAHAIADAVRTTLTDFLAGKPTQP